MTFVGTLKKNAFLVGFMGVGKTTVARRMARDMGVACVDVDAFLERFEDGMKHLQRIKK